MRKRFECIRELTHEDKYLAGEWDSCGDPTDSSQVPEDSEVFYGMADTFRPILEEQPRQMNQELSPWCLCALVVRFPAGRSDPGERLRETLSEALGYFPASLRDAHEEYPSGAFLVGGELRSPFAISAVSRVSQCKPDGGGTYAVP